MPLDFSPYQAVLLDLDGTLYHEDQALPGAVDLVLRLQQENRNFACLSNASASPLRIMARLEEMKIDIDPNNIYTAAAATCDFVLEKFIHSGAQQPQLFNLATESVDEMLHGLVDWVQSADQPCDAIIVGPPSGVFVSDERQRTALQLARRGAAIVGICGDRIFPSPRGVEFGSGAMTWMLSYAAGVEPIFCGKPDKIFFHELCRRLSVDPQWCLLIGDNLESDICGAKAVGMRTILTLSGVTRSADLAKLPTELQPDLVVENLQELV